MCIIGSAGMTTDPLEGVSQGSTKGASQDLPQDLASHLSENLELNVFPNPSNGSDLHLNISGIESENVIVRVYDSMGRKIQSNRYVVDGMLQTELNFQQELSDGLYLIEMSSGTTNKSIRLLIAK
jgi:hypothetical protein